MGLLIASVCIHFMWLSDLFNKLLSSSNKNRKASLNGNKTLFKVFDRSNWNEDDLSTHLNISHAFNKHSYTRKTICQYCNKPLKGLIIKGLQCENCQFNVHKKCVNYVAKTCNGKMPKSVNNSTITINNANQRNVLLNDTTTSVTKSKNIPLKHFLQNIKKTSNNESFILYEGWMVYYTDNNTTPKRHFWRIDSKSFTIFESEKASKCNKEIPVSDILSVTLNESNGNFELKTNHCIYYFVYDHFISQLNAKIIPPIADSKNENENYVNKDDDINSHYQIFTDDALGSGQFGTVYAGLHRATVLPVAIKVIDKSKFPTKQEDHFKNEVSILKNIQFPGIINLYHVFESNLKIYMVMEKLKGDMLSMILSSEKKRLTERCTKFLIYQIFIALKYLHSHNIAHCDLKPENVLLSSHSYFPQVKLCDFGFARIIGEKSFRRSIVGTPAYVAPEVLRNKGYNRSLDMWSVGVIIYVSLSGRFPFNEKEDITDQIMNTASMYPEILWKDISTKAINLIDNLLQVKSRNRFTVNRSLNHVWFQDYQVWCDMRDLEKKVGSRWLTQESDDARWESYRKMYHLSINKIRNKSSEEINNYHL